MYKENNKPYSVGDIFAYVESVESNVFYGGNDKYKYNNCSFKEITQADFLALPEPINIGDWVKAEYKGDVLFGKVTAINGCNIMLSNLPFYFDSSVSITKLTLEQIEVLGLK